MTPGGGKSSRKVHRPDKSSHRQAQRVRAKGASRKGSQPAKGDGSTPRMLCSRHVVLFGSLLAVYVYTAPPGIRGGDSGELLAESCHFGIPHPPGYPLINLLHYAVSSLARTGILPVPSTTPSGDCASSTGSTVAFWANILAGLFGSATAVLTALCIEEWTRGSNAAYNPGAAATGALLFCLSPLAWEYSTGAEVFALNNLLVATSLYLTARSVRRPSMKVSRVGAMVCGLAMSNQHTSALVLAPLALVVLRALADEWLLSWQFVVELGVMWLPIGLSPYAALVGPFARPQQGSWGDLSSMRGFVRHVLRQEYGTLRLGVAAPNTEGTLERIRQYLVDSSGQTMCLGPPLALLGVWWAFVTTRSTDSSKQGQLQARRMRCFAVGLVVAWTFYVFFWHGVLSNIPLHIPLSRAVHARFWMQPNLLLCVAAGAGLGVAMNAASSAVWRACPSFCRLNRRIVAAAVSLVVPLVVAAGMAWRQWNIMDRGIWSGRSHGWMMHLHGQALLSSLPEKSLLLSHTDLDLNAARYLRVCEGFRSDVTHISLQMMPYPWWRDVQAKLHPGVMFPPILRGVSTRRDSDGNAALITRFLTANMPLKRPIFLDMQAINEREIGVGGSYRGFTLVPHGLTYRVLPHMTLEGTEPWHDNSVRQLQSLDECMGPASTNSYRPGTWEFAASSVYWDAHYQAGLFFLTYGMGTWAKTPWAGQRPHLLPALTNAATLLQQTLEAVDLNGAFSSSRADLLKNTVLAEVRLFHALQAAFAAASTSARNIRPTAAFAREKLHADTVLARERCITLIPRFLAEAIDDKDAEAFAKMYIKLREDEI